MHVFEQYDFERYIVCAEKIQMMRDVKIIYHSYKKTYSTINIKTVVHIFL